LAKTENTLYLLARTLPDLFKHPATHGQTQDGINNGMLDPAAVYHHSDSSASISNAHSSTDSGVMLFKQRLSPSHGEVRWLYAVRHGEQSIPLKNTFTAGLLGP
jgi:hypothetical protein